MVIKKDKNCKQAITLFGNQKILDALIGTKIFSEAGISLSNKDCITIEEALITLRSDENISYVLIFAEAFVGIRNGLEKAIETLHKEFQNTKISIFFSNEPPSESFVIKAKELEIFNLYYAEDGNFDFKKVIDELSAGINYYPEPEETSEPIDDEQSEDVIPGNRPILVSEIQELKKDIKDLEKENKRLRVESNEAVKLKTELQHAKSIIADLQRENKELLDAHKSKNEKPKKNLLTFTKQNDYIPNPPKTRKVIAFVGAQGGIGNTYTALNIAALLAKNSNVLFIEFNEVNPLSSYLFDFENITGSFLKGIEKCIATTSAGKYKSVTEEIIRPKGAPIPASLDFLVFSQEYRLRSLEHKEAVADFEELFRRIKIESSYDYIIADFPAEQSIATKELLTGKIYIDDMYVMLSQNVFTVACADKKIEQLRSVSERIAKNTKYIVIDYDDESIIKLSDLASWLSVPKDNIYPISICKAFINESIYNSAVYSLFGEGYKHFAPIIEEISK